MANRKKIRSKKRVRRANRRALRRIGNDAVHNRLGRMSLYMHGRERERF